MKKEEKTRSQIVAEFIGISEPTLHRWKKKYPNLIDLLDLYSSDEFLFFMDKGVQESEVQQGIKSNFYDIFFKDFNENFFIDSEATIIYFNFLIKLNRSVKEVQEEERTDDFIFNKFFYHYNIYFLFGIFLKEFSDKLSNYNNTMYQEYLDKFSNFFDYWDFAYLLQLKEFLVYDLYTFYLDIPDYANLNQRKKVFFHILGFSLFKDSKDDYSTVEMFTKSMKVYNKLPTQVKYSSLENIYSHIRLNYNK